MVMTIAGNRSVVVKKCDHHRVMLVVRPSVDIAGKGLAAILSVQEAKVLVTMLKETISVVEEE